MARYDRTRSKHKKKRTVKATGVMPALGYCDGLSFARTWTVPVWPPPPEISPVRRWIIQRPKLAIEPSRQLVLFLLTSSMWPPAAPRAVATSVKLSGRKIRFSGLFFRFRPAPKNYFPALFIRQPTLFIRLRHCSSGFPVFPFPVQSRKQLSAGKFNPGRHPSAGGDGLFVPTNRGGKAIYAHKLS